MFLIRAAICISLGLNFVHGAPEVTLENGKIEGYIAKTVNNAEFVAFEGIPYARPPVGKYRFKEPIPPKPWKGTWKANVTYKCMQYNHYTEPGQEFVIGDEDCLYVNVYTPNLTSTALMDVIVYIHGGAFMFNAGSSYGPNYILDHPVVLVTLNYRLGPLGFLTTESSLLPGNVGLKDQLLALQWIKNNIEHFKGNPDSITLTGMSAGGASAHFHLLSPLSDGLFNRGISQSGVSLNPWTLMENGLQKCKQLATYVGCPITPMKEMIDCMKHRPARKIVENVKHFLHWIYNPFSPFGVVVDKFAIEPILPEHPYKLLVQGKVKDLPWMFTTVNSEGLYPASDFLAAPEYLNDIETRWDELIPHILDFNYSLPQQHKAAVLKKIRDFYFAGKPVTRETFGKLVDMISDRMFLSDIELAIRLQRTATISPIYRYHFSYRGAGSVSQRRSHVTDDLGASHADDTCYVLSSTALNVHSTDNDRKMAQIMQDIWVTFAHSSKPNVNNIDWTPITSENQLSYLHIRSPSDMQMETVENFGNEQFWHSLPFNENKRLFAVKEEL